MPGNRAFFKLTLSYILIYTLNRFGLLESQPAGPSLFVHIYHLNKARLGRMHYQPIVGSVPCMHAIKGYKTALVYDYLLSITNEYFVKLAYIPLQELFQNV